IEDVNINTDDLNTKINEVLTEAHGKFRESMCRINEKHHLKGCSVFGVVGFSNFVNCQDIVIVRKLIDSTQRKTQSVFEGTDVQKRESMSDNSTTSMAMRLMNKQISKSIRKDITKYDTEHISQIIEETCVLGESWLTLTKRKVERRERKYRHEHEKDPTNRRGLLCRTL
ncbi:hypothetical protein HHI36_017807, partial [Cryptolaemus montrouzieri]